MKTITIQNAVIQQIIISPNDALPLAISYTLLDNSGNVVTTKILNIASADLPALGKTGLTNLTQKILEFIINREGI
jgi:hypothetical protein